MKTSSAKAKGRRLQQFVATLIQRAFVLPDSDVKSLPMGAQGCDVWLSALAQEKFPFAIECKNVEKLNVGAAFEQAKSNATASAAPLLVHSKNRSETLATLRFTDLLLMMSRIDNLKRKLDEQTKAQA